MYFLPIIIMLGLVTSYEDYKHGKIRNKWLIISIIYALIMHTALVVAKIIAYKTFLALLLIFGISLVISYFMWKKDMWSAGDAKLFCTYILLVPAAAYSSVGFRYYPQISILINTFIVFMVVALFEFIINIRKEDNRKEFKRLFIKKISPKILAINMITMLGIFSIVTYLFRNAELRFFYGIIIGTTVYSIIEKIKTRYKKENLITKVFIALNIILVIVIIFVNAQMRTYEFWTIIITHSLIYLIIVEAIIETYSFMSTKKMKLTGLKAGMILFDKVIKTKEGFRIDNDAKKSVFKPSIKGLTEEEADFIKKNKGLFGSENIRIKKTIAFAPLIFLGVLMTIIFKGNVFIFIKDII